MRIFKSIATKVLAAALAFAVIPAAVPSNTPIVGISKAEAGGSYNGNRRYYGNRHGGRHYNNGRYYRGGRHYGGRRYYNNRRHNNNGAAIAGAIVGLGIGAAIAGSNQPRYERRVYSGGRHAFRSPGWYDYCAARYRSFDPRSGTFQPYNGPRQVCR